MPLVRLATMALSSMISAYDDDASADDFMSNKLFFSAYDDFMSNKLHSSPKHYDDDASAPDRDLLIAISRSLLVADVPLLPLADFPLERKITHYMNRNQLGIVLSTGIAAVAAVVNNVARSSRSYGGIVHKGV